MQRPEPGSFSHITSRCFINAPFNRLREELLPLFLQHRFQPEIGLEGNWFWDMPRKCFVEVATSFIENGLSCTVHAPFIDLAPGGFDKKIVALSREKLRRAFDLLYVFQPQSVVCHLGYEANKHQHDFNRWLDTALTTWSPLVDQAAGAGVAVHFENTYETSPDAHAAFLGQLHSPCARFCLDTGHLLAFARSTWQSWLEILEPWLGQIHLHDNNGEHDLHLAPGRGVFPFIEMFRYLRKHRGPRILYTLEPHSEADLWQALDYADRHRLFTLAGW